MPNNTGPEITKQNGVTIISLGSAFETIDESDLSELQTAILETTRTADPPLVILDLSQTKFFGSNFIEILFRAWNRMNARENGRFCLAGLTPNCAEVIETTHLDRLWDVFKTREEALQALSEP